MRFVGLAESTACGAAVVLGGLAGLAADEVRARLGQPRMTSWTDGRDRLRMAGTLETSIDPGTSRDDLVVRLGEPDHEVRRFSFELGVASSDPWGFGHWHLRLCAMLRGASSARP